ncbi:MAG: aldehyde ferredoxin oxidoreductase family protein [Planctomycetota bacterium]|jgi:aldehyde:ferredoxin oxidoreductase
MTTGWHGKYLRLDLTRGRADEVELPLGRLRALIGGVGLGAWLCMEEGGAEADPLSPEAPLIFSFSPLVGTPLTTSAKFAIVARSPLTGLLNDAISSSHFAIAGKRTGFDALVVTGRAPELTRAIVDDGKLRLESCPDLAGKPAAECELDGYRTAAIGVAGENLVRYATMSNDGRHAGRGGIGAVMGAKNLKALSVRGSHPTEVFDAEAVVAAARDLSEKSFGPATAKYRELGTIANVLVFNRLEALPTRNFAAGSAENVVSAEELHAMDKVGRASCAACTIGCEHIFKTPNRRRVRLEYESLFALGPLLGIEDRGTILEAAALCDRLGLDTISAGGTLAMAMDAGYGGLEFGGPVLPMLEKIAHRRGDGDLLAEGSQRAAESLGKPQLAMTVKGLEIPGYDPRTLQAMALGFAVGTRGADHNRSGAYELDFSKQSDRLDFDPAHAGKVVAIEDRTAAMDALILCKFLRGVFEDFDAEAGELLRQVTGERIDLHETGERICALRKLFNQRAGWTAAMDSLPERLLGGALSAEKLRDMITMYYRARGWSDDGFVPDGVAHRLGLK